MTQAAANPQVISGLSPDDAATKRRGLPVLDLDPRTYARALDCVHCGLCLPACPTYTENGLEADSPRGRIYLMKELADGKIEATAPVVEHLDLCLDCRACETACPSGVVYHELIEDTRAILNAKKKKTFTDRLVEFIFLNIFTRPARLKLAILPVRLLQRAGLWRLLMRPGLVKLLPKQLEKMQQMLPPRGPVWESNLQERYPANSPAPREAGASFPSPLGEAGRGAGTREVAEEPPSQPPPKGRGEEQTLPKAMGEERRATVALLSGCIGSVLFQDVNRKTIALLQLAGCDVLVPRGQGCCGAIHHHSGRHHEAVEMAKRDIDALSAGGVDFVVSNIAGCGAQLKDYPFLLRDDPAYADKAKVFAGKVRDISELLAQFKLPAPTRTMTRTVTYHDACHLAHGQKVTTQPRALLAEIPGIKVVPLRESDMCCGAAGTYNLTQPDMARALAERKIRHIQATGAATCVTGNVGCAMQIQSEAARMGVELKVVHPVTLLYEAYFGK